MKKLYKAALLAALGLTGVTAAQAQVAPSDVFLGFNDSAGPSGANNDYIIDLGAGANFTPTASLDLSSAFNASTFSTAFSADASYLNNVAVGAVQGATGISVFTTTPTPSTMGTSDFANAVASAQSQGALVVAGSGHAEYASSGQGWTYYIAASPSASGANPSNPNFASTAAGNPMQSLTSGVISETLWEATETVNGRSTSVSAFTDVGTLAINVNSGAVTFNGVEAVPEPGTYALFGSAGLMLLVFRNKFRRIQA